VQILPSMHSPTRRQFLATTLASAATVSLRAQEPVKPFRFPRCRIVPHEGHQTAFELSGKEAVRWHFPADYPRPFFHPLRGPSGAALTRMGHPGAPDHEHHQGIWFAHRDVGGVNFWGNTGDGRIRQQEWLCYEDRDEYALMAVRLGWSGGKPERLLLEHTLIAIARPGDDGEHTLELQSAFRAVAEPVVLGRTNFGFLAVRVAKSISAFFGGGQLTDSEGRVGEPEIFGKQAMWMDYSGPVAEGVTEGITFFDHPQNPRSPTHWHVRADGWMGAAPCLSEGMTITPAAPLQLRYLLHAHRGAAEKSRAAKVLAEFTQAPLFEIVKSPGPHRHYGAAPAKE
jgi:Methane oxygenase PmoA